MDFVLLDAKRCSFVRIFAAETQDVRSELFDVVLRMVLVVELAIDHFDIFRSAENIILGAKEE